MADGGYIVTRFAPSPTGHLHIGGARTALFCWAFAKSRKDGQGRPGRFMVRIEDTDAARSSDESAKGILEDLAWLGIEWDDGPVLEKARGHGGTEARSGESGVIGGDARGAGPFFQARRVGTYDSYILRLVEQQKAYPAFETAEELDVKRKEAAAAKRTYRYDRAALAIPLGERLKRMSSGEPHVVRFCAPAEALVVRDQVLGDVTYGAGEMDDFVIRKADGFPTYHFAVVVDDELMGVTHVLRAQEHLNNTPRHVALQAALGFRTPVYGHMPLIFNMDGSKMSKRDKDKAVRAAVKQKGLTEMPRDVAERLFKAGAPASLFTSEQFAEWLKESDRQLPPAVLRVVAACLGVAVPEIEVSDFRESGYLPEAIVNFLGLLGWSPGMKDEQGKDVEKFDRAFLAKHFSLERIGKGNAKFDRVKLASFNQDYLRALPDEEFERRWCAWCEEHAEEMLSLDAARFGMLARAVKPRAKTFADAAALSRWAVVKDEEIEPDAKAVEKVLKKGTPTGYEVLREIRPVLAGIEPFSAEAVQGAVEAFCSRRELGVGAAAQPLRVAMTGTAVSPPLGETLAVLGREHVLARVDRTLKHCDE